MYIWGKGYAKESCLALAEQTFSCGVHRIFAECDPENLSSWKLLKSLGFEREAHLKQNIYFWKDNENKPIWFHLVNSGKTFYNNTCRFLSVRYVCRKTEFELEWR